MRPNFAMRSIPPIWATKPSMEPRGSGSGAQARRFSLCPAALPFDALQCRALRGSLPRFAAGQARALRFLAA